VAKQRTILDMLGIGLDYLTEVVRENPSLRGVLIGYVAEKKLRDWFLADGRVTKMRKDDDHDRANKADLVVAYEGFEFRIEVKSLQANSIMMLDKATDRWIPKVIREPVKKVVAGGKPSRRRWIESEEYKTVWRAGAADGHFKGGVQCDASDKLPITLPDGRTVTTTNLRVGDFDILAMGLFAFRERWDFAFVLNRDLPRSTSAKYPQGVRSQLIKTMIPVSWPLPPNYASDPFTLLDKLVAERRRKKS
jgi:hypothetical protein